MPVFKLKTYTETTYVTSDGNKFDNRDSARRHEAICALDAMFEDAGCLCPSCEREAARLVVQLRDKILPMLQALTNPPCDVNSAIARQPAETRANLSGRFEVD